MKRRSRHKTRRSPKYLSLRRHLTRPAQNLAGDDEAFVVPDKNPSPPISSSSANPGADLDRDLNVTCLLDGAAGGGGEIPTLDDLLGGGEGGAVAAESSGSRSVASSMNWDDGDVLARRALRGRERLVYCRMSSASTPEAEEEASSGGGMEMWWCGAAPVALALKLDHEQILSAWSDRGSLYIDGEAPQVFPQVYHTAALPVLVGVECSGVSRGPSDGDRTVEMSREARVMRYKEKRRNRLFAKRIRYEVRKLNAEKRPRWKGRFVKRLDDDDDLS